MLCNAVLYRYNAVLYKYNAVLNKYNALSVRPMIHDPQEKCIMGKIREK